MTILKTKADVDNLRELHQRKAELKTRMAAEQTEILNAWQAVRTDFEPAQLVGTVAKSLLGIADKPATDADQRALGMANNLKVPLKIATDLLVRNSRFALLLRLLAPMAVAYWPRVLEKVKKGTPGKTKIYGTLRKGVTGLRQQLRRKKSAAPLQAEEDDIVQPS